MSRSSPHLRPVPGRRRARTGVWLVVAIVLGVGVVWLTPAGSLGAASHAAPRPAGPPVLASMEAAGNVALQSASPAVTPRPRPKPTPTPVRKPAGLAPLRLRSAPVTVHTTGFFSWALMDRRTGQIWGSTTMTGTTWTASMIKAWLGADYLRRAAASGQTPDAARLHTIEIMIRDSDNDAAQQIYLLNGGNPSILRLISLCHLSDTAASTAGWSFTSISARDTVRMANCIAGGTAAGRTWTSWILQQMRAVRGVGDFGIRSAFAPDEAATVSIKNGWLDYDDDHNWHINCMAVTDTWALAVLQRFPDSGPANIGFTAATTVCRDVTTQLLNPRYVAPV